MIADATDWRGIEDALQAQTHGGHLDWTRPMETVLRETLPDALMPRGEQWGMLDWYGPLELWRHRPGLNDVRINSPHQPVVLVVNGSTTPTDQLLHESWIRWLQLQLLRRGRQPTQVQAWSDGRDQYAEGTATGGLRYTLTQPPYSPDGPSISLRRLPTSWPTPEQLVTQGVIPAQPMRFLTAALHEGGTVLVSGATSSGKTTFLATLMLATAQTARMVVLEDTPELPSRLRDGVALAASALGKTFTAAVKDALRMNPERLVLGELRGAEAAAFIRASVSGHNGLATIHASTPGEAVANLESYAMMDEAMTPESIHSLLHGLPLVVVQLKRVGTQRQATEIAEVRPAGGAGRWTIAPLWRRTPQGQWEQGDPPLAPSLARAYHTALYSDLAATVIR